jgi:hypothetical protein
MKASLSILQSFKRSSVEAFKCLNASTLDFQVTESTQSALMLAASRAFPPATALPQAKKAIAAQANTPTA